MTTSAFRLKATSFDPAVEPRRTRRSATAPAKSVRFATSPPAEWRCSVPKEPSNPDLSSLGPIITKIDKKVRSESANTVKDESTTIERLQAEPTPMEQEPKPTEARLMERPKTAPTKPSLSPMEVKDIEIQESKAKISANQVSSTTPQRPVSILKPRSAPSKCTGSRARVRLEGTKTTAVSSTSQVMSHAKHVKEQTNHSTHVHTRMMRHDVAILRSKMIKLEEELRLAARSRSLLESGLQEIRKSMSMNHQSISTQQRRKRSSEESLLRVLMEESQVLSSCKRNMEQHLATIKACLQSLDSSRKNMESKMAVLGRALALDTQNFKVFNGPTSTKGLLISHQRHYSTSSKPPSNTAVDQEILQFVSRVSDVIKTSKKARGDLLAFLVSMKSTRSKMHSKVTETMSTAAKDATSHRQNFELQRGKVKLERHLTSRQKHTEEISLGLSLGPHSEHYRETSEKYDRPLSRLRPEAIPEEKTVLKETTRAVSRQLSDTTHRDTQLAHSDQKLKKKIRDKSSKAGSISRSLRIRKASLDQKWVES